MYLCHVVKWITSTEILQYNFRPANEAVLKRIVEVYSVNEVVHYSMFLVVKSGSVTKKDLQVAQDLLDTLIAHKNSCVGMAANMIGVRKRIIVFDNEGTYMIMFNPEIIKKSGPYDTEEGCLSLLGGPRKCKRYQTIRVQLQTDEFKTRIKTFTG